jgi:hypothetical protein
MNFSKQSLLGKKYFLNLFVCFFSNRNALNVLKDDLLVKIEEFSKYEKEFYLIKINYIKYSEQEILREEVDSLQTVKGRLQSRLK